MEGYRKRLVDPWIQEVLSSAPALMITGPRAVGKTTTALRHVVGVVRLDTERAAAPFRSDPDAALRDRAEPVLLDEWQECPGVLGAVKRAVDSERRAGRYILTGSVRSDTDPLLWPGTGRLIRIAMHPLTVREQAAGPGRPFLERLLAGDLPPLPADIPDLRDYVQIALRGGFPEPAIHLQGRVRAAWLAGYVEQLAHGRPGPGKGPDPVRLDTFIRAYALNSAGIVSLTTLDRTAGINRRTTIAYIKLLTDLGVIAELPAWSTNRLKRLTRQPKRYVADTGLWRAAVGVDTAEVMNDGNLLGRLIDTFVTNQLRAEAAADPAGPRLYHLRDRDSRHEVDAIADWGPRGLVAIEIKAHSAPTRRHARHLAWLRDRLGDLFRAGVVLHTGPARYRLGESIEAIPICVLWTQ